MTLTKTVLLIGGLKHGTVLAWPDAPKFIEFPVWQNSADMWFASSARYCSLKVICYSFTGEVRHADGNSVYVYSFQG